MTVKSLNGLKFPPLAETPRLEGVEPSLELPPQPRL